MKNRSLISALAFAGLLAGPALSKNFAQDPAPKPSTALARIQSTFRGADADNDKFISGREAGKAGIPTRDFAAHDSDRDRRLSESEFLLYYRFLLVKARRPVDKDIETEVARIQAARRARQAEEAKKNQEPAAKVEKPVVTVPIQAPEGAPRSEPQSKPQGKPQTGSDNLAAKPGETAPAGGRLGTSERLRRARASLSRSPGDGGGTDAGTDAGTGASSDAQSAVERSAAMRLKQRSAEMRAKLAGQEEERRVAQAAELERRAQDMRLKKRSEEMRAKQEQEQEQEQAAGAEVSQEELARRSEAMRLKTRSEAMRAKLEQEGRKAEKSKPRATDPESAGTRAQRYASRFVEAGLMTAKEGRELSEALSSGRVAALEPAQRTRLLSSLTRARKAVGDKLAAGKIGKKEAGSLKELLDGHVKVLAPADSKKKPVELDSGPQAPQRPALGSAPKDATKRPDAKPAPERVKADGAKKDSKRGKKGKSEPKRKDRD